MESQVHPERLRQTTYWEGSSLHLPVYVHIRQFDVPTIFLFNVIVVLRFGT